MLYHQILKLEKQLQHVVNEMEEKACMTGSLERTLEERQKMLQESNCRITELEEKESHLQQQVCEQFHCCIELLFNVYKFT